MDSSLANKAFAKQEGLSFPLLSDFQRTVSQQYGILNEQHGFANRTTFVVDKGGVIRHIEKNAAAIDPSGAHAACSLLEHKKAAGEARFERAIADAMKTKPTRSYSFIQVDVFTSEPLKGNPLAVFTDARGLSHAEMQALAREMNLSETTFISPRDLATERERGVQVRIFTTEEELPFAGHPTLGTAFVLRKSGAHAGAAEIALDLKVGRIPVTFREDPSGEVFAEMRQRDPEFGEVLKPATVAELAGLQAADIAPEWPIQVVSTGVPFAIVPVKTLRAVREIRLDWKRLRVLSSQIGGAFSFYFVTPETEDPAARLHARMVLSNGEDPATGSAAGCCAAWMVKYGLARSDEQVLIEQGLEIHRPSRIFVRAGLDGGRVTNVRVGGHAVEVLRGEVSF